MVEQKVRLSLSSMDTEARGVQVDNVHTILTELKSCVVRRDLPWGRRIHAKAVATGNDSNLYVTTALIKMYAKCGSMVEARAMFDSIQWPHLVVWTALLLGYAEHGEGYVALDLFFKMKTRGHLPDSVTYVAVLKACTALAVNGAKVHGLEVGRRIHSEIGYHLNLYVQSTLIRMYSKCNSMAEAQQVFDSMRMPDIASQNALLLGYAENGMGSVALDLFSRMKAARSWVPNSLTYVAVLKACTSLAVNGDDAAKAHGLEMGRKIHLETGSHLNLYVQNTLIDMYAKCNCMPDARWVFDNMRQPSRVSWNALLTGYAANGKGRVVLDLFHRMKAERVCAPDPVTYVAAIKACAHLGMNGDKTNGLKIGKEIHSEVSRHSDLYVQNALIDMYAKCGSMTDSRLVFDGIEKPDVVSWTALMLGYAENGEGQVALELFKSMKAAQNCVPDSGTYVAVLKACTSLVEHGGGNMKAEALKTGRKIHSEIGCLMNICLQGTLVEMYAKCGSMVRARLVFDSISKPNVVCWTALLLGYAENGNGHSAVELFSMMKSSGCAPNSLTYIAVLKACGLLGELLLGRRFHSEMSEFTAQVTTCLVDFYGKCGSMVEAREVFELHYRTRDISTWNALLAGYSTCGDTVSVFKLFEAMQDEGFKPDTVTFLCMLLCCSHAGLVVKARKYLKVMPLYGVTPTVMHYTCIVDTLGRANELEEAMDVLREMPCNPDVVIWMTLLSACCKWKSVEIGSRAFRSVLDLDSENATAYVLMARIYASQGMWEEQRRVLKSRAKLGTSALPGRAYVSNEVGEMVRFAVGEEDLPEVKDLLKSEFGLSRT